MQGTCCTKVGFHFGTYTTSSRFQTPPRCAAIGALPVFSSLALIPGPEPQSYAQTRPNSRVQPAAALQGQLQALGIPTETTRAGFHYAPMLSWPSEFFFKRQRLEVGIVSAPSATGSTPEVGTSKREISVMGLKRASEVSLCGRNGLLGLQGSKLSKRHGILILQRSHA